MCAPVPRYEIVRPPWTVSCFGERYISKGELFLFLFLFLFLSLSLSLSLSIKFIQLHKFIVIADENN